MINLTSLPSTSFDSVLNLPNKSGVYAALAGEDVLYVGAAISLVGRWAGKHHRLKDLKDLQCSRIVWREVEKESLRSVEREWIETLCPKLNGRRKHVKVIRSLPEGQARVGQVIRSWRLMKDIGIREAAKEIGVSHGTLSRIERGDQMDAYTMMKLLRWLFEVKNGKVKGEGK